MTFWCGSGSADPCHGLMDPDSDPDPAIFVIDLQGCNKKSVLRIRIHMFLGLPDPDPLVRGMDPDPDPSIR
jgi:hypothetical protein